MADPLSIAGLATGVVSLGLQLFETVKEYLDAVKARSEEVESTRRQADNMRKLLEAIHDLLPRMQADYPTSAAMVQNHVKPCEAELHGLNDFLLGLCCTSTNKSGIRSKLEEQRKKLSYPFNRTYISQLESRLEKVNSALQMALQLAEINISIDTNQQIRRLHDRLLGVSNLTLTGETRPLQTQSARAQPKLMNSNATDAVFRLASKPSYLKSSSNELESSQRLGRLLPLNQAACICRPSRRATRQRNRIWAMSFSFESSSVANHVPDCPFSQINKSQHAMTYTAEFENLKWLLQKAIGVSFSLCYGAGGFSISPGFTYYPAVNEKTAPAFRIMDLCKDIMYTIGKKLEGLGLQSSFDCTNIIRGYARVIEYSFDEVLSLYRRGEASPRDIDSKGRSLMHHAATCTIWIHEYSIDRAGIYEALRIDGDLKLFLFSGINQLIASGVPLAVYDTQGETLIGGMLSWHRFSTFHAELASLFFSAGLDAFLITLPRFWMPWYRGCEYLKYYRMDLRMAEAITGNEDAVSDILERYPATRREVNVFGQTPIHLAVLHPNCLRLIVNKSEQSIIDYRDMEGYQALDYAAQLKCEESVVILIENQCSMDIKCLRDYQYISADVIVTGLKTRLERLKSLAVKHLSELEITRLNLGNDYTLDRNGIEVQQILEDRGIMMPDETSRVSWHGIVYPWLFDTYCSVFHLYGDTNLLDLLWDHKFRDINSLDYMGRPPLLTANLFAPSLLGDCYDRYIWLIEHGANLWAPLSIRLEKGITKDLVTPAHFLFATIGRWWDADLTCKPPSIEVVRSLTKKLLAVHAADDCLCKCTLDGCTPLTMFLKCLNQHYDATRGWVWSRLDNPQAIASTLVRFIQEAHPNLTMEQHLIVVRYMTHEALDIVHTCCRFNLFGDCEDQHLASEEVEEINGEQSYLLGLLDDLVVEFEQISRDDRNGMPLGLCDPEEFWTRCWVDRMNAVLEELNGDDIGETERSEAEAIGVVWDTKSTALSELETEPEPERTPEYFLGQLEEIMKKYR
ncbi:hypothetical protein F4825DRAFT_106855 [Nemania diffusa]|nr:hypothetical protein F4825DRAFT_106855 [Nemania diffusa]